MHTKPPDGWSATENVEWKADIPGRGWPPPIVRGDRVFLTTVVDRGESRRLRARRAVNSPRGRIPASRLPTRARSYTTVASPCSTTADS